MINKQDYSDSFSFAKYIAIFLSLAILFFAIWSIFLKSPTKIIENYEWFHQSHASHQAYKSKIQVAKPFLQSETDADEKYRLRQELAGLQNMCYNGVQYYNARASQITTRWAQDSNLPQTLNKSDCE